MRTISVAAFSAAVLLTASAYAQSQTPSGDTTPRGSAPAYSPAATPKAIPQNPLKQEDISKIEGTTVLGNIPGKGSRASPRLAPALPPKLFCTSAARDWLNWRWNILVSSDVVRLGLPSW